jgi:hypothetical protein
MPALGLAVNQPGQIILCAASEASAAYCSATAKLRCALCGALLTAPPPPEAGLQKYDPSCGIMLAVSRYGMGVPMYRTAKWQAYFGVPLPPATQWEQIEAVSRIPERIYEALLDTAAQAQLLHNDDTPMRVQSLRQESSDSETSSHRTGIFTASIIAQVGHNPVALFFTGQNHAGENLNQVLQRRDPHRVEKPLQMCDALSRNLPKEFETLVCKCLLHGRRRFIDSLNQTASESLIHLFQAGQAPMEQ